MAQHIPSSADEKSADLSPERSDEHRALAAFVGDWKTAGHLRTEDGGVGKPISSVDIYEWLPGGFFVAHRWESQVGDSTAAGLEIIGYDAAARTYRTHFFDKEGGSGSEELTRQGNTWTWRGTNVMGTAHHRCISTLEDDGRKFVARHERSEDGVRWTPWMDVTLTRET